MSNDAFSTNLLRPGDGAFNSFPAVIDHDGSAIGVFRVGNNDPTPEVRLKASIFRQREHISFLEITITIVHESNDNMTTGFITDKTELIMTA